MTYFTVLHWFVLFIILTLFILVVILVMRNPNEKSPFTTIGVISGLLIMVFIISLYGLDEYTKVARLENITQRRVLSNESFNLSGQIRNIGGFKIGQCTLEVEIYNDTQGQVGNTSLYTPKSFLGDLFTKAPLEESVSMKKEFVIARDLEKGEMRNFSISMPYPPAVKKPVVRHELSCR